MLNPVTFSGMAVAAAALNDADAAADSRTLYWPMKIMNLATTTRIIKLLIIVIIIPAAEDDSSSTKGADAKIIITRPWITAGRPMATTYFSDY